MAGDTSNIIIIADHAWYDWIQFYNPVGKQFSEENLYLERYLGPAIDAGPALTAKILKSNGEVLHHSTYQYLLPGLRRKFDVIIEENLSPKAFAKDFEYMGVDETPIFENYDGESV